jgi:hypothetical protein
VGERACPRPELECRRPVAQAREEGDRRAPHDRAAALRSVDKPIHLASPAGLERGYASVAGRAGPAQGGPQGERACEAPSRRPAGLRVQPVEISAADLLNDAVRRPGSVRINGAEQALEREQRHLRIVAHHQATVVRQRLAQASRPEARPDLG